eukprot:2042257-Amphidinium_carterae.1
MQHPEQNVSTPVACVHTLSGFGDMPMLVPKHDVWRGTKAMGAVEGDLELEPSAVEASRAREIARKFAAEGATKQHG